MGDPRLGTRRAARRRGIVIPLAVVMRAVAATVRELIVLAA
jgi:hypothetical protein